MVGTKLIGEGYEMHKFLAILFALVLSVSATGCAYDSFGHEIYTDVKDYKTAFELSEIRFGEARDELFPKDISAMDVKSFYFEWELGFVGSAGVETLLSVKYEEDAFLNEISRLQLLADGNVMYDEERFSFPAYVTVLGELNTSVYALVDDHNFEIHYIHLQLLEEERIDIAAEFLPDGYFEYGEVTGVSFDAYNLPE